MESETEIRNALQAIHSASQLTSPALVCIEIRNENLNLVLFTKQDTVQINTFSQRSFEDLRFNIESLKKQIADRQYRNEDNYLKFSQNLYDWIIKPLEAQLSQSPTDTLIFSLHGFEADLLPLEALHDREQFLIQQYQISRIRHPSDILQISQEVRGVQARLQEIDSANVLVMGTSTWKDSNPGEYPDLTFGQQIDWISTQWLGNSTTLREQEFSLDKIEEKLSQQPFEILHLVTHASFNLDRPQDSFIELWDSQMNIDEFANLLSQNPVNLLVLGACQTASGNGEQVGFAELANQVGVKTVVASQWDANQLAALVMMTAFHRNLKYQRFSPWVSQKGVNVSQALRQVQIDAIEGEISIENSQIIIDGQPQPYGISEELADHIGEDLPLDHPYFWATFTLVGSPLYISSAAR